MRRFPAFMLVMCLTARLHPGEMETAELASSTLGQTVKINVLLPDGYKDDASRRFPTVYLLHGYGGDYTEWQRVGVAEEAAKLAVIVVMPEGDKSFYVNHHESAMGKWEDYIVKEVVGFIDERYRTKAAREHRAVSGLSMGGYGAMVLGLRHPETFASIASHSGALGVPGKAVQGEIAERLGKIFGPTDSAARRDYDLLRLSKDLPAERRPHIYIDCGSSDFLLADNRAFVAHLSSLRVPYEYRETQGGHDFKYWKSNIRYSLTKQLEALEAAALAPLPAAVAVAAAPAAPTASAKDVLGTWDLTVKMFDQEFDYDLRLEEVDGKLKGTLVSPRSGEYSCKLTAYKDGVLRVEIDRSIQGNDVTFIYEGKLENGKLGGKVELKDIPDAKGEWNAAKKATKV